MKHVFLSLAVALGAPVIAQAQTMPLTALDFLDVDDSATVTSEEIMQQMELFYDPMDTNANGRLEFSEVESFMSRDVFDAADENGNGTMSRSEYRKQVMKDFTSADVDGDGVLD